VFGSTTFHWKSSICRSALYNGAYNDADGGEFLLQLVPVEGRFLEGLENGIKSFSAEGGPNDNAMLIREKKIECPIDDLQEPPKD